MTEIHSNFRSMGGLFMVTSSFTRSWVASALIAAGALAAGGAAAAAEVAKLPTFRVAASDPALPALAERFEVLQRLDAESFEVAVHEGEEAELLRLAPQATLWNADRHAGLRALPKDIGIYDVASMERRLRDFVARYPGLVKLETYGTSYEGRPEYVLTMAKDPGTIDPAKPEVLITSATHGDEVITVEVTLGLIERLLVGYGKDERLTRMVDGLTIRWIPANCVDGYANRSRYVQGQDPNRDFAWPENPNRTPRTKCIQHAVEFFHAHPNLRGTMDIHASGGMIMFPWAYTYDEIEPADYRAFDDLTTRMARTNGFSHGPISKVIYVAKGSSADYYYWKTGTASVAIEVSHDFAPRPEEVSDIVTENAESTWLFLEHFLQ
jgi:predicted deacylase